MPRVFLPLKVSVLQHPKEKPEQSSINSAKIFAPEQVEIYKTKEITEIKLDPNDTVLLFPREDAKPLHEVGLETIKKIKHVVVIDCTWGQVNTYLSAPQIKALPAIRISAEKTTFWRYQYIDVKNLATIEALYLFFKEYDTCLNISTSKDYSYDGKYDNLLYFYVYNYNLIQEKYKLNKRKVYLK